MALIVYTKDVAEDPTLTDENGYWIPEYQSIVFATMFTGINQLKPGNIDEFYARYLKHCLAYGFEPFFTREIARKFIGLATNASTKTISAFNRELLEILERRAQETLTKQEGN